MMWYLFFRPMQIHSAQYAHTVHTCTKPAWNWPKAVWLQQTSNLSKSNIHCISCTDGWQIKGNPNIKCLGPTSLQNSFSCKDSTRVLNSFGGLNTILLVWWWMWRFRWFLCSFTQVFFSFSHLYATHPYMCISITVLWILNATQQMQYPPTECLIG